MAVFLRVLFGKIANDRVFVGAGNKMIQQPRCDPGGMFQRHAFSPYLFRILKKLINCNYLPGIISRRR
jgi:hypothetical protein